MGFAMADDELLNLSERLGLALKAQGQLLALAESCTGGMASQYITAIAGSSAWFDASFVTYSNHAKTRMLGVSSETIAQFGAVSEQTALEMAIGALAHSQADIAVAVTGIAGPDGGSAEKPVGTVCFAWAHKNGNQDSATYHFSGDRETVREASVKTVFEKLLSLTLPPDL
jgi:nicotinamide-nucleotide amidase